MSSRSFGAEILHHFRVTLDYPHDRLILEQFETPNIPETDMSGITWESEPPSHNTLTAVRVQDNSPAAEATSVIGCGAILFPSRFDIGDGLLNRRLNDV